jgi:hypothetical protein
MFGITLFLVLTLWSSIALAGWEVETRRDMMTDAVTKSVCGIDSNDNQICLEFASGTELWVRFVKSSKLTETFAIDLVPVMRVDDGEARSLNALIGSEEFNQHRMVPREVHPDWVTARYQVVDSPNDWDSPRGFLYQLRHGKVLKIRLFLVGGYKADSIIPLDGLVDLLRQIAPSTVRF